MRLAPLVCVHDVPAVSDWYQKQLGCTSGHGGDEHERLMAGDELILQLHRWDAEHAHGQLGDPNRRPCGNGVVLWFELNDFDGQLPTEADGFDLRNAADRLKYQAIGSGASVVLVTETQLGTPTTGIAYRCPPRSGS